MSDAVRTFPPSAFAAARAQVAADVAAFGLFAAALPDDRRAAVEGRYFANALVALDARFASRDRALEGADGNAINEVRLLVTALLHDRPLDEVPPIRYRAAAAVLGLAFGQPVVLAADPFRALAEAYLQELEGRYLP